MASAKNIKNLGTAIAILGLIFMVVVYIKDYPMNYVLIGLLITNIGTLISSYGAKQLKEK